MKSPYTDDDEQLNADIELLEKHVFVNTLDLTRDLNDDELGVAAGELLKAADPVLVLAIAHTVRTMELQVRHATYGRRGEAKERAKKRAKERRAYAAEIKALRKRVAELEAHVEKFAPYTLRGIAAEKQGIEIDIFARPELEAAR